MTERLQRIRKLQEIGKSITLSFGRRVVPEDEDETITAWRSSCNVSRNSSNDFSQNLKIFPAS